MAPWVYDPHSGGVKIPERVKVSTKQRILAYAKQHYAGKYNQLTNAKSSIKVTTQKRGDAHALITAFTMKAIAQYKVVDDIAKTFKLQMWNFEDYQDMTIQFPE